MSVVNRFPSWGKTGETPNIGFQYDGGDQVNEKHLNFLWDAIQKQTDDFITETDGLQAQIDDIDANGDGIVDEADTANLYKGNDIDTNGDGKVNSADTADTADSLTGNNVTTVNSETGDVTVNEVPSGGIMMWSGSIASIPSGWTLCDGTNGAPNLQDRFIVGAGTSYTVGDTGGQDEVTLTEAQLASHSHSYGWDDSTNGVGLPGDDGDSKEVFSETEPTGGDEAHENRPPYYALAFIMKL